MLKEIRLPEGFSFTDLALEREPATRNVLFAPAALGKLCLFNGLDPDEILADEDLSSWVISEAYLTHRLASGEPDPVAEEILAEVAELQETRVAALQPGSGGIPN